MKKIITLLFCLFSMPCWAAGFPVNCATALTYATATNSFGCNSLGTITLGTSASVTNPQRSGDATTGLFSPSTTTVAVATGGNQLLTIGTTGVVIGTSYAGTAAPTNGMIVVGSVGIGTTTSGAKLDISSGADTDILIGQDPGATHYNQISLNGVIGEGTSMGMTGGRTGVANLFVNAPSGGAIVFRPNGSSAAASGTGTLTINGNGNVGFLANAATGNVGYLSVQSGASTNYWNLEVQDNLYSGALQFSLGGGGSPSVFMVLNQSGQLGIGTNSPVYPLQVNGNIGLGNTTNPVQVQGDSSGNITIKAGATNQNVVISPSGTGTTSVSSNLNASGATGVFNVTGNGNVADLNLINAFMPNQQTGKDTWLNWGQAGSVRNASSLGFYYAGAGSTSNRFDFAIWGVAPQMSFTGGGLMGIGSTSPRAVLDISQSTGAMIVPVGTTGTQPSSPVNGMIRYNSTLPLMEGYLNNIWGQIFSGSEGTPTCGTGCSSITSGSTDARGSMTVTSLAVSAVVNFSTTLPYTPFCGCSGSLATTVASCTNTTSALTATLSVGVTGDVITWTCPQ